MRMLLAQLKKASLPFAGFVQATALVVYILLVAVFMNYLSDRVPKEDTVLSPVLPLLLLVISAVVSGVFVMGRAGQLYFAKRQRAAFELVGWTIVWAVVYFGLFVGVMLNT